jgi:hypothetical protein
MITGEVSGLTLPWVMEGEADSGLRRGAEAGVCVRASPCTVVVLYDIWNIWKRKRTLQLQLHIVLCNDNLGQSQYSTFL